MSKLNTYYVDGSAPLVAATHLNRFILDSADAGEVTASTQKGDIAAAMADNDVIPALALVHTVDVPDAATGNVDVTLTYKFRVTSVTVIKTGAAGGAGDTIQVASTANPITDAMSINVADLAVVRNAVLDDAYCDIPASGVLRVIRTKASAANTACRVHVHGYKVA